MKYIRNILDATTTVGFLLTASVAHAQITLLRNPTPRIGTLNDFITLLITIMQWVVTPFLVVALVYSGFVLVTAQGDERKLEHGKTVLVWTLVGAAILLGARVIATAVQGTVDPFIQAVR